MWPFVWKSGKAENANFGFPEKFMEIEFIEITPLSLPNIHRQNSERASDQMSQLARLPTR